MPVLKANRTARVESEVRGMPATGQTQLLELESQMWKARAQAKQKWLERTLAEPARNAREAERRAMWINQALDVVKRGQDHVKHQAALMDAYAEHLSVLEMSLIAAAERARAEGKRATAATTATR
jgi:hypothetical protein